jgi:hypothetical protein
MLQTTKQQQTRAQPDTKVFLQSFKVCELKMPEQEEQKGN